MVRYRVAVRRENIAPAAKLTVLTVEGEKLAYVRIINQPKEKKALCEYKKVKMHSIFY